MGQETSLSSDDKAVSSVVAVILLVGLTLAGVTIILATGWMSIDETNQQADMAIAEETMLQIDSTLEQSSGGNTTVTFPDQVEGSVAVSNAQSYRLTLNGNTECTTGWRNLSSVEYEDNGQRVAYQGGGVWRMTESGATMTSPPDVTYDGGALDLGFTEINGQIQATNGFRTTANTTRQRVHQYNLTRALYTDGTYENPPADGSLDYVCRPAQVENATLEIKDSQYARAWADWARNNYDDTYVSVSPTGAIDAGDTVSIQYALGDVSDPHFDVSDVGVTRPSGSDPVTVTATVKNTGGLRTDGDVTFDYAGVSETQTITLSGGESKQVSFTIPPGDVVTGTESLTVSTADDSVNEQLTFDTPGGVPSVELDASSVPRGVATGAEPTDANVTMSNVGGMTAFEQVTLSYDGESQATWNVTVAPGESTEIDVGEDLPTSRAESTTLTFSGNLAPDSENETFTLEVGNVGYFDITGAAEAYDIEGGDTLNISARVNNTGDRSLEETISITVTDDDTGAVLNSTSTLADLERAGAPGDSTTVSLEYDAVHGPGDYRYRIETPNETTNGTFTVSPVTGPNFVITSWALADNPVDMGNETTLTLQVNNTGTEAGTQTVWLNNTKTGETVREHSGVSLAPGEGTTISWDFTVDTDRFDMGLNELETSTADASIPKTLRVTDPATYDVSDGEITVNEAVNVTVTMVGAELEGAYYAWDGSSYVLSEFSAPVEMTLRIENSSGTYDRVLWEDVPETGADTNHPVAERAMQRDEYTNVYTEEISFEPGTSFTLFATSYYCNDREFSGVIHPNRGLAGSTEDTRGLECTDRGGERLRISEANNPENLVIRGDGDSVPGFDQASPYQLTLEDMLGDDRIDDGELNLASGEEVFLYELSQPNADPDAARNSPNSDPDYNDAIARFQVNNRVRTVQTPAEFEIIEADVPALVDEGDDAQLELTVRNNGGRTNDTPVRVEFDGTTMTQTTTDLANNETDTVTFTLPTGSRAVGSYTWTAEAVRTAGSDRAGFVTVGERPVSDFQAAIAGPTSSDIDDDPKATVDVTNVGEEDGTQTVVLEVKNDSNPTWRDADSTTLSLDAQETKEVTLDLPSAPGNYSYRATTENATTPTLTTYVGKSNVSVDSINIVTDWAPGELIELDGRMTDDQDFLVNLVNDGTVGDDREVRLTITNESGSDVYTGTRVADVGQGPMRAAETAPAQVSFDVDQGTGYYTYELVVYNDTAGDGTPTVVEGELYLRDVSSGEPSATDSPVTVDSQTVTVN